MTLEECCLHMVLIFILSHDQMSSLLFCTHAVELTHPEPSSWWTCTTTCMQIIVNNNNSVALNMWLNGYDDVSMMRMMIHGVLEELKNTCFGTHRLGLGVTNLVKERRRFIFIHGILILPEVPGVAVLMEESHKNLF